MILKCYFGLNYNENIKLIFTDVPVTNEIDFIMNNILKDDKDANEFFFYFKLNLLLEKYLWLSEECKNRCSTCSNYSSNQAHMSSDDLFREYIMSRNDNYVTDSICDKIISAANNFKQEPVILTFVETDYFHQVIQGLCRQLDKLKDTTNITNFDSDNKIYNFENEKDLNKFGIALNLLGKTANE
jgi:hypothetical protein